MKAIIFSLLLFYSFCSEMIEVKNSNFYSFASGTTKLYYIDISKSSQNDVIHFAFIVHNGEMDSLIQYQMNIHLDLILKVLLLQSLIVMIMMIIIIMIENVDINIILISKKKRIKNIFGFNLQDIQEPL